MSTETHSYDGSEPTDDHDVAELAARVHDLEERLERYAERLAELEGDDEGATPSRGDHRDAAVLEALDPGETVAVRRFKKLYRRRTDLMNSGTIADRIRNLVTGPEFETCGDRVWQYRPQEGGR